MVIFVMALNTLHDLITKFCLLAYWGLGIRVRSKARQNAGTYEMVQYIWHREQYLLALFRAFVVVFTRLFDFYSLNLHKNFS